MGVLLLIVSFAGIMGARNKDRSWLLFYILGVTIILLCSITTGVGGFVFVHNLSSHYEGKDTGKIACQADLYGCSNCTGMPRLPCDFSTVEYKPQTSKRCIWDSMAVPPVCRLCVAPQGENKPCEVLAGANAQTFNASSCAGTTVACEPPLGMAFGDCKYSPVGGSAGNWDCTNVWSGSSVRAMVPVNCNQCPEWTKKDVESYIETNLKFLGLLAFMLIIFLVVGFTGAVVLRKSLINYQTDSI